MPHLSLSLFGDSLSMVLTVLLDVVNCARAESLAEGKACRRRVPNSGGYVVRRATLPTEEDSCSSLSKSWPGASGRGQEVERPDIRGVMESLVAVSRYDSDSESDWDSDSDDVSSDLRTPKQDGLASEFSLDGSTTPRRKLKATRHKTLRAQFKPV